MKQFSFVINLDKRPERWKSTQQKLYSLNHFKYIPIERFSAVNGYDLCNDVYQKKYMDDVIWKIIHNTSTRSIECGVLGVLLSHYFLLKQILNDQRISVEDVIYIFEDDLFLGDDVSPRLDDLIHSLSLHPIDMIYLGGRFHKNFTPTHYEPFTQMKDSNLFLRDPFIGFNLFRKDYDRTAHSYLLRKRIIPSLLQYILDWIQFHNRVVEIDTYIYGLLTSFPIYDMFPHLFYSPLNYKSDIQDIKLRRVM